MLKFPQENGHRFSLRPPPVHTTPFYPRDFLFSFSWILFIAGSSGLTYFLFRNWPEKAGTGTSKTGRRALLLTNLRLRPRMFDYGFMEYYYFVPIFDVFINSILTVIEKSLPVYASFFWTFCQSLFLTR